MRTYFLTFILCLFATNISFTQEEDFNHLVSKYSQNFLGTWKYESEDYSFSITFTNRINGNWESLRGTYQVQMNGQYYEDFDEKVIEGFPKRFDFDEPVPKFNSNEIFFQFVDRKYFNGSNEFAISWFTLTMQKGRKDRAVLSREILERTVTGALIKNHPTQNLFPPDGTVLIKQKK